MYLFVPSVHPRMNHNYGVISGRHTPRESVWPIILVAQLYTTCRRQRVLVVIRFNHWTRGLIEKKMCSLPVSWTMQKV